MQDEIKLLLERIVNGFIEVIPRLIISILVVLIAYLIGRLAEKLVKKFVLYLDRLINERLETSLLKVNLKSSSIFLSKALFWIIMIISLLVCIKILRLDFLSSWLDLIISYLPNVLAAIVIVFVGIILGRLAGDLIKSAASRTGIANGEQLGRVVRYLILFVGIVISADQLGVDIGFLTNLVIVILAALLFGASLAFGLGARTSVSNILGSFYARKIYQIGTTVKIGDYLGIIVEISDHAITLDTKSGLVVIPANEFNKSSVTIIDTREQ